MTTRTIKLIKYQSDSKLTAEIGAITYGRHSTDNQPGTSSDDQLRRCARCIERGDIKPLLFPSAKIVLKYELRDDAISGFGTVGRDGLNRALSLLRAKEAQILLVDDFKRFVRDMGSCLELFDELQELGVELYAVSDGFSSAEPGARLKFMSKAYQSEEFLDSVSRDTKRGLDERRYEGFSDGHLWFGVGSRATRQVPIKGGLKDSHFDYYVIEPLAELVRRIFRMCADGYSTLAIASKLNEEMVPPPPCYDKEGNARVTGQKQTWRDKTVWRILNRKAYIGIIERGKTKVVRRNDGRKHTIEMPRSDWIVIDRQDLRIVPQDLWEAVRKVSEHYQACKAKSSRPNARVFKYEGRPRHVLTGICTCAECGSKIVIVSGRHDGRYGCAGAYKFKKCGNRRTIIWSKLELPVLGFIASTIKSDAVCSVIAEKYNKLRHSLATNDNKALKDYERRLADAVGAIANIVDAIERGSASQALMTRLGELERTRDELTGKIKNLRGTEQSQVFLTPQAVKARFDEVADFLMGSEPYEVNRALRPLVSGGGNSRIVLEKRLDETGKENYWAAGSINVGKLVMLSVKAAAPAGRYYYQGSGVPSGI